jgi:hypothetical protein
MTPKLDELTKSIKLRYSVIPVKTGIHILCQEKTIRMKPSQDAKNPLFQQLLFLPSRRALQLGHLIVTFVF